MPTQLTWDDLLIQNIDVADARLWLGCWSNWATGQVAPVFLSKFGDWFLRRPDGRVDELSVLEGTYVTIASSFEEFTGLVNTPQWQETHLLSLLVQQLHERGMIPGQNQCYAFSPHPAWTGRIDLGQAMIMDMGVWQNICAQTFADKQPRGT